MTYKGFIDGYAGIQRYKLKWERTWTIKWKLGLMQGLSHLPLVSKEMNIDTCYKDSLAHSLPTRVKNAAVSSSLQLVQPQPALLISSSCTAIATAAAADTSTCTRFPSNPVILRVPFFLSVQL